MKHTFTLYMAVLFALLSAYSCSNDLSGGEAQQGDAITIKLRLGVGATAQGNGDWKYDNGQNNNGINKEMMQNGFVVMVNDKSEVEHILVCQHLDENLEKDLLEVADGEGSVHEGAVLIPTTTGNKRFFSFVNLDQAEVEKAIGENFHFKVGEKIDTAAVAAAAISVCGEDFVPGDEGIPMTGNHVLSLSQKDNGQERELYVVRLLAKLQFKITNNTGESLTVNSVTIDRLTENPANGEKNLRLFSSPYTPSGLPLTLVPNLTPAATQHQKTYEINATLDNNGKGDWTYYVNETSTPKNQFGQFLLTVGLTKADGTTKQQRYALVSNDNDAWNFIARNDWRTIPIVLQDYKVELVPRDFPAIGVLPCSVQGDEGTFTCTFYADGDFHLTPRVTRYSSGQVVENCTLSDVTWETLEESPRLYETEPYWYELGGYVHGRFQYDIHNGSSRHVLNLTVKPEGNVARRFTCPVIVEKK